MSVSLDKLTFLYNEYQKCDENFLKSLSPDEKKVCEKVKKYIEARETHTGEEKKAFDEKKLKKFNNVTIQYLTGKLHRHVVGEEEKKGKFIHEMITSQLHPKQMESQKSGVRTAENPTIVPDPNVPDLVEDVYTLIAEHLPEAKDVQELMMTEKKKLKSPQLEAIKRSKLLTEISQENVDLIQPFLNFARKTEPVSCAYPWLDIYFDKNGHVKILEGPNGSKKIFDEEVNKKDLKYFRMEINLPWKRAWEDTPNGRHPSYMLGRPEDKPFKRNTSEGSPLPVEQEIIVTKMLEELEKRAIAEVKKLQPGRKSEWIARLGALTERKKE